MAILSRDEKQKVISFLVNKPFPFSTLNSLTQSVNDCLSTIRHGIKWNDGNTDLGHVIRELRLITREAKKVFVRDPQIKHALEILLAGTQVEDIKLFCPPPSDILFLSNFELCPHNCHIQNNVDFKFDCSVLNVQKFRKWLNTHQPLASNSKNILYCCELKCFKLDNTEVDGLACNKCGAYGQCHCQCKQYTFKRNFQQISSNTEKRTNQIEEISNSKRDKPSTSEPLAYDVCGTKWFKKNTIIY